MARKIPLLKESYDSNPAFKALVDHMESIVAREELSRIEVMEAAVLVCTRYFESRGIPYPPEGT